MVLFLLIPDLDYRLSLRLSCCYVPFCFAIELHFLYVAYDPQSVLGQIGKVGVGLMTHNFLTLSFWLGDVSPGMAVFPASMIMSESF